MSSLYIAQSKQIAARLLDGEMMIMSARDSTLFSLRVGHDHLAGGGWRDDARGNRGTQNLP